MPGADAMLASGSTACRCRRSSAGALGVWGGLARLGPAADAQPLGGLGVRAVAARGRAQPRLPDVSAPPLPASMTEGMMRSHAVRHPHRRPVPLVRPGAGEERACFAERSGGGPSRAARRTASAAACRSGPCACRACLRSNCPSGRGATRSVVGDAEVVFLEPADLVAQPRGFLELEVGGGLAHALLEVGDDRP